MNSRLAGKAVSISEYRKDFFGRKYFPLKKIIMAMIRSVFKNEILEVAVKNEERSFCLYTSSLALHLQMRGNNV